MSDTIKTLPAPSEKLKRLLDAELAKPQYQKADEDTAMIDALQVLIKEHGPEAFDFTNTTDQTLLRLAQD